MNKETTTETPVTLVVGASENSMRYSYLAVNKLTRHGHPVIALGNKAGNIGNIPIITHIDPNTEIDTITLYVGPARQKDLIGNLLSLNPKRIIFNPGTENPEFINKAREQGIEVEIACTLVMLSAGTY